MKKIVIASACRTAIGKFGGTLANVPAAELGSIVIKEALNRAHVAPEQVDHVYMGCVIQAGLGQNVARQAALKAGLPIETPAVTVNVVCGSGLNCVNMAAQMIEAGDADIVVAGGMENMDMAPFAMMKGRYGYRMGAPMGKSELVDTMVNDALWDYQRIVRCTLCEILVFSQLSVLMRVVASNSSSSVSCPEAKRCICSSISFLIAFDL